MGVVTVVEVIEGLVVEGEEVGCWVMVEVGCWVMVEVD